MSGGLLQTTCAFCFSSRPDANILAQLLKRKLGPRRMSIGALGPEGAGLTEASAAYVGDLDH